MKGEGLSLKSDIDFTTFSQRHLSKVILNVRGSRDEPNVGLRCLIARSSDTTKGAAVKNFFGPSLNQLLGLARPSRFFTAAAISSEGLCAGEACV